MRNAVAVEVLDFVPAPGGLMTRGVVGWVRLRMPSILLNDVALRRTADGRFVLSYPERRGRSVVRPLDDDARRAIEAQVIRELRRRGDVQ